MIFFDNFYYINYAKFFITLLLYIYIYKILKITIGYIIYNINFKSLLVKFY